jgi:hypothetical protein
MKKSGFFVLAVIFVGIALISCEQDVQDENPNGGDPNPQPSTGTFKIRVTDIPAEVITYGFDGYVLIVMGPPNKLSPDCSNAVAGIVPSLSSTEDVITGPSDSKYTYEFYMYNLDNSVKYTGTAGRYDIGFINFDDGSARGLKNVRLEVNKVNVFSYNAFQMVISPSVQTPLPDPHFDGRFLWTGPTPRYSCWTFDGTNKAVWEVHDDSEGGYFDCEIKLENGHFWMRLWGNPLSDWIDRDEYSFDGDNIILGGLTHIKQLSN